MPSTTARKAYLDQVLSWPIVSVPLELGRLRGRVVHLVYLHDDWCRTLNGGTGADCNCRPEVTFRLRPKE
jgi:hypothetical protein